MGLSIERIEILLLIAGIVAVVARRLGLPYTVGLVVTGAGLSILQSTPYHLTKDLIFNAFLPPLIFEAAIQMPWRGLRRDLPVTMTLATVGVLLAAAVTAAGIRLLLHWDWFSATLVGVILSATDPVSVIATFKEAGVKGRLRLLVEAESLFNDGTAAVLFVVVLRAMEGGPITSGSVTASFLLTVAGALAIGAAIGGATLLLAGPATQRQVELVFTTVAAYGSFLVAEHFHLSGVLATLTCGVLIGNLGPLGALTEEGHQSVVEFWDFAAFVANSLIFLLIGLELVHQHLLAFWQPALLILILVLLGRAAAVYGCLLPFGRSSLRVTPGQQHVLFWGGLRGALALALVLGLPAATPNRTAIITAAFAVVAFSVIIQGLTIRPLLQTAGAYDDDAAPLNPTSTDGKGTTGTVSN